MSDPAAASHLSADARRRLAGAEDLSVLSDRELQDFILDAHARLGLDPMIQGVAIVPEQAVVRGQPATLLKPMWRKQALDVLAARRGVSVETLETVRLEDGGARIRARASDGGGRVVDGSASAPASADDPVALAETTAQRRALRNFLAVGFPVFEDLPRRYGGAAPRPSTARPGAAPRPAGPAPVAPPPPDPPGPVAAERPPREAGPGPPPPAESPWQGRASDVAEPATAAVPVPDIVTRRPDPSARSRDGQGRTWPDGQSRVPSPRDYPAPPEQVAEYARLLAERGIEGPEAVAAYTGQLMADGPMDPGVPIQIPPHTLPMKDLRTCIATVRALATPEQVAAYRQELLRHGIIRDPDIAQQTGRLLSGRTPIEPERLMASDLQRARERLGEIPTRDQVAKFAALMVAAGYRRPDEVQLAVGHLLGAGTPVDPATLGVKALERCVTTVTDRIGGKPVARHLRRLWQRGL